MARGIKRRAHTVLYQMQKGEPRLRFSSSDIAPVSVRTGPATNPVTV